MYKIKRDYKDETKQVLKQLNAIFYAFSVLTVDFKNYCIILNDNDGTVINCSYQLTLFEVIHANFKSIKSLEVNQ